MSGSAGAVVQLVRELAKNPNADPTQAAFPDAFTAAPAQPLQMVLSPPALDVAGCLTNLPGARQPGAGASM